MRDIKFRALKDDMSDCKFVYGNLIYSENGEPRIQPTNKLLFTTCIKETEGQYTGLKDKNGKEIYEGDIVKAEKWKPKHYEIAFIEGGFCAIQGDCNYPIDINHFYDSKGCMIEVIGNIYDNAELLEV